jgi:hypothetical protein
VSINSAPDIASAVVASGLPSRDTLPVQRWAQALRACRRGRSIQNHTHADSARRM